MLEGPPAKEGFHVRGQLHHVRSLNASCSLASLPEDERCVYELLDEAGADGLWARAVRGKTGMAQAALTRCLKKLEERRLVTTMMNAQHPSRKMYLLQGQTPSNEIAGGPWLTVDHEIDHALVETMASVVERFVEGESWHILHSKVRSDPLLLFAALPLTRQRRRKAIAPAQRRAVKKPLQNRPLASRPSAAAM